MDEVNNLKFIKKNHFILLNWVFCKKKCFIYSLWIAKYNGKKLTLHNKVQFKRETMANMYAFNASIYGMLFAIGRIL